MLHFNRTTGFATLWNQPIDGIPQHKKYLELTNWSTMHTVQLKTTGVVLLQSSVSEMSPFCLVVPSITWARFQKWSAHRLWRDPIRSNRPANSWCYDPIAFHKRSDRAPYRSNHDLTWSCWRLSSAAIIHRVVTLMDGPAVRCLLRRHRFRPRWVLLDLQHPLQTWTETVCYRHLRFTPATVL